MLQYARGEKTSCMTGILQMCQARQTVAMQTEKWRKKLKMDGPGDWMEKELDCLSCKPHPAETPLVGPDDFDDDNRLTGIPKTHFVVAASNNPSMGSLGLHWDIKVCLLLALHLQDGFCCNFLILRLCPGPSPPHPAMPLPLAILKLDRNCGGRSPKEKLT